MPSIMITWLPKECRNAVVRKKVAGAILKALTAPDIAEMAQIPKENIVIRFSEAVDGFPLPKGFDINNVDISNDKNN